MFLVFSVLTLSPRKTGMMLKLHQCSTSVKSAKPLSQEHREQVSLHCYLFLYVYYISAFDTNFSNENLGVCNFKYQNSCTCVYKSFFCEKLRLVSFKKLFHTQLYLFICCVPRVTRLRCSSLLLNTLRTIMRNHSF